MTDWEFDRQRFGRRGWLIQPAYWAVAVYRFGRWTVGAPRLIKSLAHSVYFFSYLVVRSCTGIDIPRSAEIGPGLMIHHFGGIIVHPQAKIGSNCTLRHGVTIGVRHEGGRPPKIGNNVDFGAYAQILGDIAIGDNVRLGAMSVVISSVPEGHTAVGNPARLISKLA